MLNQVIRDGIRDGMIRNICPVDLHPLSPIRVSTEAEGKAAVQAARTAQAAWETTPFKERVRLLKRAAKAMLARRQEVLELLHDEVGKTPAEALMTEAVGPLQLLSDCARIVRPYLKSRKLPMSPLAFPGKSGKIETVARGVVGIIAPWNYPLAYFFKPVFPALLCGNAVIIKPSEYSPRTALWFTAVLNEFLPEGLISCLVGDRETGQALVRSGIDAVTFTGSFKSGREVCKLAAEQMIPCSAELGGKDAAIVLADCAMDRTVAGIMQWALHNAGQACGAIDRVYVEGQIADEFVARLGTSVAALRVSSGDPRDSDIGPLSHPLQLETVEALVADALAKGAVLVCGGKRTGKGLWFEPTVLDHCNHTMKVCQEPTFGPVIPIVRVADAEEAVTLANDSAYGLCGSIWSQNARRAAQLASRLAVGTAFINNHSFTGGVVAAPWTGVKQTGYGIANSTFGLAHYTRPRTQVVDRSKGPDIYWFPINGTLEELGHRLAEAQLGRVWSALKIPFLMRKRKQQTALGSQQLRLPETLRSGRIVLRGWKDAVAGFRIPLFKFERAWARAAFETIFPDQGTSLAPIDPEEPVHIFQDFMNSVPIITRIGVRAMIWGAGLSPILLGRAWVPLNRASIRVRLETFEALNRSKWFLPRQVILVLKMVGALSHAKTTRIQAGAQTASVLKRLSAQKKDVVQPTLEV